jgi:F420-dependent oxidoreductase-like protein
MIAVGLMIEGQWGLTWARWSRLLQVAEDLGFQCVFRSDHYTIGPPDQDSLETFVSLTYAAMVTRRIEFGPLVAPTTFRHPVLTARMAAQIDDLSEGRMNLGLGTGWHEREHRQYGIPFYDQTTRYERLEEALEITTRLFRDSEPLTFKGKHFSLEGAVLLPRPVRPGGPPIILGGNGQKRSLPLAARYANEWNGFHLSPKDVKIRNDRLDELLESNGRGRKAVKRSLMLPAIIGRDDADLKRKLEGQMVPADSPLEWTKVVGVPSQAIEQIHAYGQAGLDRLMLMWQDQDDIDGLEVLASQVLPHFHRS